MHGCSSPLYTVALYSRPSISVGSASSDSIKFDPQLVESVNVRDFTGGSDGKESVYNVGDLGSIPGLGRSPGEGNGNPLQYYCLENPMDRGAW